MRPKLKGFDIEKSKLIAIKDNNMKVNLMEAIAATTFLKALHDIGAAIFELHRGRINTQYTFGL